MKKCIGYKIRKIREIKNISQDYVAKHLGITQGAYSSIESGKVSIDDKKLVRIAAALNIEMEVIKNFNEQTIFDMWLQADYTNKNNFNPLEKLQDIYEKLLKEKDSRIELLQRIANKESIDICPSCVRS